MATEKQIAANRANAVRSTGPKTALGKFRSRKNALRHGLSLPVPQDEAAVRKIDALAHAVVREANSSQLMLVATEMARAQVTLMRINKLRDEMMGAMDGHGGDSATFRRVAALDRYERYARTKRRRAADQLEALLEPPVTIPKL